MIPMNIMQHFPVLSVMSLFLGAFFIEIFGRKNKIARNVIVLFFAGLSFLCVFSMILPVFVQGEIISYWLGGWEPVSGYAIGIAYEVDSLSLFFALLVAFTFLLSAIYSIRYMERDDHLGHYYTLFFMLSGGVLGLVLTGDIFNMYVMVEILTFAAVALTAFRNYKKGALESAFKYLVIGSIGSGFTLTGICLLYMQCHTLNLAQLAAFIYSRMTPTTIFALALLFIGFGVKSFMVPFHTPAADAYATAPSSISMVFSGMVNKAGVYGMIRLLFVVFLIMDKTAMQILLVTFGTVTMFIGVTMALAQHDFKRLLAFHSISQIGYILAASGLSTLLGVSGSLFHAMNHTLFKGLLFLCAGAVYYATGTTNLDKLGGLSKKMPKTCICFLIGAFSISGLPPFNGFVSKWMIYQAAWGKGVTTHNFFFVIVTVAAVVVSVMTLASFIKVTQAVFFGQPSEKCRNAAEVPLLMRIPMWIMSALCILTGIFYQFLLTHLIEPAVHAVFHSSEYIDKMMGSGYAFAGSVTNHSYGSIELSYWDPVLWLILFVILVAAVCIVIFTGKRARGPVLKNQAGSEGSEKYATFFGGEKSEHSHVAGSDLFWGLKKNWSGYFRFMQGMHSGNVNDYALYTVVASAVIIVVIFIFVH